MLALVLLQTMDNGTCDAVALLYRRYERLVFKVALSRVQSEEDAEDAVHDAFIWLIKAGKVPDPDDPKAPGILAAAAKEKAIDIYRKKRMRSAEPLNEAVAIAVEPNMDAVLMVKSAISQLPEELRDTLILSVYCSLTTAEIADIQGLKRNTVQKRLIKAKEQIRTMLAEDDSK